MEEEEQVREGGFTTTEFSLRIRHPKPRLDSGIPGTMKNLDGPS